MSNQITHQRLIEEGRQIAKEIDEVARASPFWDWDRSLRGEKRDIMESKVPILTAYRNLYERWNKWSSNVLDFTSRATGQGSSQYRVFKEMREAMRSMLKTYHSSIADIQASIQAQLDVLVSPSSVKETRKAITVQGFRKVSALRVVMAHAVFWYLSSLIVLETMSSLANEVISKLSGRLFLFGLGIYAWIGIIALGGPVLEWIYLSSDVLTIGSATSMCFVAIILAVASFFNSELLIAYAVVPLIPLMFVAVSPLVQRSDEASKLFHSVRVSFHFSLVGFSVVDIPIYVLISLLLHGH